MLGGILLLWSIANNVDVNKTGTTEIFLYDDIDSSGWWGISAKALVNAVKSLGDIKHIVLRIHSLGGDVGEAQAMYSYLKNHTADVTVHVDGIAASAATIVAMAGNKVIMPSNAIFMIHNPSTWAAGESDDMRKAAEMLDKFRDTIVNVYRTKTGLSADKLIALMDAESWLTAEEAKSYGFVDEIEDALPVSACAHNLSNIPAELKNKLPKNLLEVTAMAVEKKAMVTESVTVDTKDAAAPATAIVDVEAIKAEAIAAERARLKELDDLMAPGCEEIINKAKYEEPKDARDVAIELLKASRNAKALADRHEDAKAVDKVITSQAPNLTEAERIRAIEAAMAAEVNNLIGGVK